MMRGYGAFDAHDPMVACRMLNFNHGSQLDCSPANLQPVDVPLSTRIIHAELKASSPNTRQGDRKMFRGRSPEVSTAFRPSVPSGNPDGLRKSIAPCLFPHSQLARRQISLVLRPGFGRAPVAKPHFPNRLLGFCRFPISPSRESLLEAPIPSYFLIRCTDPFSVITRFALTRRVCYEPNLSIRGFVVLDV